jgi:hypothetical protein
MGKKLCEAAMIEVKNERIMNEEDASLWIKENV